MKGELEQDIRALGFASLSIFRPPSLIRPNTNRLGEKIAIRILNGFNHIGLLAHMRSMTVETLTQALIHATQQAQQGTNLFEANDIWQSGRTSHPQ